MASENAIAKKERLNPQGAQPTERSENERAVLAENGDKTTYDTPQGVGTGVTIATENTENARAQTV